VTETGELGRAIDARARAAGLHLTSGGELTFTVPCTLQPEWRAEALGDDKRARGRRLASAMARRFGGSIDEVPGRQYDGEDDPRWCVRVAHGKDATTIVPDPGVIEVNLAPARTLARLTRLVRVAYDAASEVGLAGHRLLHNGRVLGSGGGAHVTLGGPSRLESPFEQRPRLLADLVAYFQAHPSLSHAFVGLGAGPTSQAPRADESGVDRVRDLAATVASLRARRGVSLTEVHAALQPLLCDLTGNTHRAELNVEKILTWGVLELRAVEAPPEADPWLSVATLFRAVAVRLAERRASRRSSHPAETTIVDWGPRLHDEWLLPSVMRADLARVLGDVGLPKGLLDSALEHRYPVLGTLEAPGVRCTVRQALEPWPVLGPLARQETAGSRQMDSSTDRIEVALTGPRAGDVAAVVAGRLVPGVLVGRAWVGGVRWRADRPSPGGLHPHAPIHAPLVLALVHRGTHEVLAAAGYHSWSPDGLPYPEFPADLSDAAARRKARFVAAATGPAEPRRAKDKAPRSVPGEGMTLDLVRD
jgi:uncharacterized protein (DUF2126 family)